MSIANFLLKCKQSGDGVYSVLFKSGFDFTTELVQHTKRDDLKRLLVLELLAVKHRINDLTDDMIREVLSDS